MSGFPILPDDAQRLSPSMSVCPTEDRQCEVYISNFLVFISNMNRDGTYHVLSVSIVVPEHGDKVLGLDPLKAEGTGISMVIVRVGRGVSVVHCN